MKQQNKKTRRNRVICIVLAVFILMNAAAAEIVFGVVFSRYDEELSSEWAGTYREVDIPEGKYIIKGYLFGEGNEKGPVIMAHGINATAQRMFQEANDFADDGWVVLVVDGVGCGQSDGRNGVGLGQRRLDLLAAMDYLESSDAHYDSFLLYGHSAGAYSSLVLCNDPRVKAVASVAAFDSQTETMTAFAKKFAGPVVYMGYPFMYMKNIFLFGTDGTKTAHDAIADSEIPILLIEAENDTTIPTEIGVIRHLQDRGDAGINPEIEIKQYTVDGESAHNALLEQTEPEVEAFLNRYAQ